MVRQTQVSVGRIAVGVSHKDSESCRIFLDLDYNPQIHPSRASALALMDLVRPSTGGTYAGDRFLSFKRLSV